MLFYVSPPLREGTPWLVCTGKGVEYRMLSDFWLGRELSKVLKCVTKCQGVDNCNKLCIFINNCAACAPAGRGWYKIQKLKY
jgi:hypothetical protein